MLPKLFFVVLLVFLQRSYSNGSFVIKAESENDLSFKYFEPNHTEHAKLARYIVHRLDWSAMGTISTDDHVQGYPMVNVIAMADSPLGEKSTGQIYFLLTDLDFTGQDLKQANRLTAFFSMEQYKQCSDPMEPTCARVMISGQMIKLATDTEEYAFGNRSMLSRHPNAANWVRTHSFYLCKLDILQVIVLSYYGGPHYVTPDKYFAVDPDDLLSKVESVLTISDNLGVNTIVIIGV